MWGQSPIKQFSDPRWVSYILTPLVLWYESGMEVKVVNSVESQLEVDDKGNITYESFVEFLSFPEEKPNWNEEFNLTSFQEKRGLL